MMKNNIQLDALRLCLTVERTGLIETLKEVVVTEAISFEHFRLLRIEGKYFDYVYVIQYFEGGELRTFGELKFSLSKDKEAKPIDKVWLWVENRRLYESSFYYLDYIINELGLAYRNPTVFDLCLDVDFNVSKKIKQLIKNKETTVFLNGKRVKDRAEDRPEIKYITSGSLNKTDKYLSVSIKQKKAMRDKTQGLTLLTYDKLAEINNASGKDYIKEVYGSPSKLYRVEVHLNHEEIKDFLIKYKMPVDSWVIWDQRVLTALFFESLNGLIFFKQNNKRIMWEDILERGITTLPENPHTFASNYYKPMRSIDLEADILF